MGKRTAEQLLQELNLRLREWEESEVKERLTGKGAERFHVWYGALANESKPETRSGSGDLSIKRVYSPLDTASISYLDEIGLPGQFPFTRGRDPVGYRAWEWPLCFYTGYGRPQDTNARLKKLYEMGARELDLAFDLPTQLGYGCEHPLSFGEVGKVGVVIDTAQDLAEAYSGLPLEDLHIGTVGNCIGPWVLALFYVLGERHGIPPQNLHVWLQNDPFKEYNGRGTCIFPLRPALDLAADTVAYTCNHLPLSWEPQYVTVSMLRWGGCSAAQEIGFGIANIIPYVEAAVAKGIKIEDVIPRFNLHMSADNDLFEEVAKFRATRKLWAKLAKERFNTTDPRVLGLRLTAVTSGYRLARQEPLNNIVRLTMHMLAAILGGVEHIVSMAYDEALALPTIESTYLSSMIKVLLHDEGYIGNSVDPLGGSYFLERATVDLEEQGQHWYQKVESMGGAVEATSKGYYLEESAKGMYKLQKQLGNGERVLIGVNKYKRKETNIPIEIFMGNPDAEKLHQENVVSMKTKRDRNKVESDLGNLKRIAEGKMAGKDENIVPAMIQAVRDDVTVGEIFDSLREILGEYRPVIVF